MIQGSWCWRILTFGQKKGQKIAFVGESGSGKTTLSKLLLHLYTPETGDILINGNNIEDIQLEYFWRHIFCWYDSFNDCRWWRIIGSIFLTVCFVFFMSLLFYSFAKPVQINLKVDNKEYFLKQVSEISEKNGGENRLRNMMVNGAISLGIDIKIGQ